MPGSEWTRNICRGESDVNVSDGFKTSGPWQKVLGTRNGKFIELDIYMATSYISKFYLYILLERRMARGGPMKD